MAERTEVGIKFSYKKELNEMLKTLEKSFENSNMSKGFEKTISEMKKEIDGLAKKMDKAYTALDSDKLSSSEFLKFKENMVKQVNEIEIRIQNLAKGIQNVGSGNFVENITQDFSNLRQEIESCSTELTNLVYSQSQLKKLRSTATSNKYKPKTNENSIFEEAGIEYDAKDSYFEDTVIKIEDATERLKELDPNSEKFEKCKKEIIRLRVEAYKYAEALLEMNKIPAIQDRVAKNQVLRNNKQTATEIVAQNAGLVRMLQGLDMETLKGKEVKFVSQITTPPSTPQKPKSESAPVRTDDNFENSVADVQATLTRLQEYIGENPLNVSLKINEDDEAELKTKIKSLLDEIQQIQSSEVMPENSDDTTESAWSGIQEQLEGVKNSAQDVIEEFNRLQDEIDKIGNSDFNFGEAFGLKSNSEISGLKDELKEIAEYVVTIAENAPLIGEAARNANNAKKTPKAQRTQVSEDEFLANLDAYTQRANEVALKSGGQILNGTSTISLENGIVKVRAKIKDANDEWKNFTAKIDGDGKIFGARFSPLKKNISDLENQLNGVSENVAQTENAVQSVEFKPNTDSFEDMVSLLGIAEDKAENIKSIVKESRLNAAGNGFAETYRVKYNNGDSYTYNGENGNITRVSEVSNNVIAKLEDRKRVYSELTETINRFEKVRMKIAKDGGEATPALSGEMDDLKRRIEEIQNNPILTSEQVEDSKRKFEEIIKKAEELQKSAQSKANAKRGDLIKKYSASIESEKAYVQRQSKPSENTTVVEQAAINRLKEALTAYQTQLDDIKNKDFVTEEQLQQVEKARAEYIAAKNALKQLPKSEKGAAAVSVSKMINNIDKYISANSAMSAKYKRQLKALKDELIDRGPAANVADIQSRFEQLQVQIREAGQEGKRFIDVIKEKAWYGLATQIGTFFNFTTLVNGIRSGVEAVKELDSALTEMRKVSDESVASLRAYQKETFDIANQVGTTAKQLQNSTADWMRLGESMSNASKSAKATNVLFNVSEFQDVSEATDALVSLSSAYKDVDKMDIVDKLNEIGNNFSISTDGLATSLQDSASSLLTAGNTIDEAMALTAAGNAIVQDPSKTGSGLRTIALRLVGTKAAKEALAELGEEAEDVITTPSKLRWTIMDATAAATEDKKGFDIFDSNGNYKSTYEILLGLSQLYNNIVKTDKEMGTNNLNLLLETIAGKNRSNIAASILQNPKILSRAYESSQNASGSAQEELNKYLDSVEGKLTKFQNEAEKFWYTFISSESVKNVITDMTDLLSVVTKIVEKLGSVPALLTAIGGLLSFKNIGKTKCCLREYAYNNKVSCAKREFYILSSVKHTVEFADMATLCIWSYSLMIEGRESA